MDKTTKIESPNGVVEIHCDYSLLRAPQAHSESSNPQEFRHTHSSGRTVEVVLSYADASVKAKIRNISLPAVAIAELRTLDRFDGAALSGFTRGMIDPPLNEIRTTVRNLLALLKYHLRHFDLREQGYSVRSEKWGIDADSLRDIPSALTVSHEDFSSYPLNHRTHDAVQEALNSGVSPLIAMRHLHRAKHESEPHHKWIDATISAELAVKEALCRAHPKMELMLMEMPSPPFSKMYGSLLKHYLGEESPFRKQLIAGQERRNVLVHRPGVAVIDQQEANDYVALVEGAIFHLLGLLYPNDVLIGQAGSCVQNNQVKAAR